LNPSTDTTSLFVYSYSGDTVIRAHLYTLLWRYCGLYWKCELNLYSSSGPLWLVVGQYLSFSTHPALNEMSEINFCSAKDHVYRPIRKTRYEGNLRMSSFVDSTNVFWRERGVFRYGL